MLVLFCGVEKYATINNDIEIISTSSVRSEGIVVQCSYLYCKWFLCKTIKKEKKTVVSDEAQSNTFTV